MSWSPHSVPALRNSVKYLAGGKYAKPRPLVCDVLLEEDLGAKMVNGLLKRLSPEEDHAAFVLATRRDLEADENVDESWSPLFFYNDHLSIFDVQLSHLSSLLPRCHLHSHCH